MAITCVSTITPIDVSKKIVRIEAAITNDDEPTHIVIIKNADISTGPKKAEVANIIWAKYVAKRNEQIAIDNIQSELDQLQTNLNTNIEGRSV